jgi:hypothetical protein
VWEKISEALSDHQPFAAIAKKLSAAEVTPPADMWRKIEANLNNTKSRIVTFSSVKIFAKYIVPAAAFLGIIVTVGYFVMQNSSQQKNTVASTVESVFIDKDSALASDDLPETTAGNEIGKSSNTLLKNTAANRQTAAAAAVPENIITTSKGNAYTTTIEKNKEMDGNYIVIMTKEGNVVRMNKKMSSMADCIAGDDNSQDCDNKITEWQKELANVPALATPDNILALLELANKEAVGTKL